LKAKTTPPTDFDPRRSLQILRPWPFYGKLWAGALTPGFLRVESIFGGLLQAQK